MFKLGIFVFVFLCGAKADVIPVDNVAYELGYHAAVGIPLAAEIKAYEESLTRSRENFPINVSDRIVGGTVSSAFNHPYYAGLIVNFWASPGQSVCGATLVSPNRLVTAAHCWFDGWNQTSFFTVVLGSEMLFSGGVRVVTTTVFTHPQYNAHVSSLINDVAIVHLPTRVTFSNTVQPVALPTTLDIHDSFFGEVATAVGYGRHSDAQIAVTNSTIRREVSLRVISAQQCMSIFHVALPSNICTSGAGGVGICNGDSGGPLTLVRRGQRILVGVSSFVDRNGCERGNPSGFARITSFYNFILQHLL